MNHRNVAFDLPFGPLPSEEAPWQDAKPAGATARRIAVLLLLFGVTIGQRFCIPMGASQIPIVVILAYFALYLLISSGQARINTAGFMLYSISAALMIATLYFGKIYFSAFSVIYLIVLYLVWVFTVDIPREEYVRHLAVFQKILVFFAVIALAQYIEQVFVGSTLSLFDYIPDDFWLTGYNTRPTLGYGSTFYKANAEFFLEPSFLSQYMAVGIIIEILYFGKWWRMALYGVAIFCSFSGTGMMLLALFSIFTVLKSKRYELLIGVPVLLLIYLAFQDSPYVTAITGRVGEFDAEGSSAFMRFIGPNQTIEDLIYPDFGAFLVGKGPGLVEQLNKVLDYQANYPVMHKLLIEYGIVGLLPFMAFATFRFFGAPRSRILAGALFVMYLFLSGSLLQPHTIYLFYVLSILFPLQPGEA
jgi:hypothetical protein